MTSRNKRKNHDEDTIVRSPFQTIFHAALLILGAIIALNIAIAYLRPILPWLIIGGTVGVAAWGIARIHAWRRDHW